MRTAIEIVETATDADRAAEIAMGLMALDGFLGGRVYRGGGVAYSKELGRMVLRYGVWKVQMFFQVGTMVGPERVILDGLAAECGM